MQENLLILRKNNNITQEELANKLGISTKTYGYKESGKTEFTMNEMFIIAKFFQKPVEEIFLPSILQNGVENDSTK